jgi:uncharacterized alkaline shock family protein YloU
MAAVEQPATVTGSVRVANEVIASIAAMAAREIDGVADLDEQAAHQFGDWLRRRDTAHQGVRVDVDADKRLHLRVFLRARRGVLFSEIAELVQANVVEAVERMLGLEVAAVDVLVSSVDFG